MDNPLYGRSYWSIPSRSRPRSSYAPSVREIPVQYVGSEEKQSREPNSAVKIQKVFRAFLVRKSVKKIKEIRGEVEEIEKRISTGDNIDLIARDSQERLKLNEMLMSLLFRLDSVRGVDSGVRDCRKAVIKKAIALQEFLDAAFSSNNSRNDQNGEDENVVEAVDEQNQSAQVECTEEDGERTEAFDEKETVENQNEVGDEETVENQDDDGEAREVVEECDDVMPSVSNGPAPEENVGTSQSESEADSSANPEEDENSSPKQENNAAGAGEVEENVKESGGEGEVEENVQQSGGEGARDENSKNKELLERMMEDHGRMMEMMAQLFERNEMQTRLLSALSHRVEQLEKAFMRERLRRKKKKNAAGAADGCETSRDNKKCGKR